MATLEDQERLKAMSQAILRRWSGYFQQVYGDDLPRDYLVFDTETSGLDRDRDLPLEIGHCIVRDCQVVSRGSFVLNWADDRNIDFRWLQQRMRDTKRTMDAADKGYRFNLDLLRTEGRQPRKVLDFYRQLFHKNRKAGGFLVGQNAWFFDAALLEGCFEQFLGDDFRFGDNELFDCGTMEKACLVGESPLPKETLKTYFLRIKNLRAKGVSWNLAACLERHDLVRKYALDLSQAHNASWDSYACHLLFEEHR